MATLTIRNLDDKVYEKLKGDAKRHHRSIEAEARVWFGERAAQPEAGKAAWLERLDAINRAIPRRKVGKGDTVLDIVREMREER